MTSATLPPDLSDADVVGRFVVRVRRRADLSQRELAERVGVAPSTISRLESGRGLPGMALLVRVLRVAGLHLAVSDDDGAPASPVPADVVRDNGRRRFPAHLDVAPPDHVPEHRRWYPRHDRPEARAWFHHRKARDRAVAPIPVRERPEDHPTERELNLRRRLMTGPQPRVSPAPRPEIPCTCEDACFESWCIGACPCQCEAAPTQSWSHARLLGRAGAGGGPPSVARTTPVA